MIYVYSVGYMYMYIDVCTYKSVKLTYKDK